MIVHELKTWPTYFRPVWDGEKPFEVRFDDRGFQRGDVVNLREWDPARKCECHRNHHDEATCSRYTGRRVVAEVGYVLASTPPRGQQPGFRGDGYVVLALINAERVDDSADEISGIAGSLFGGISVSDAAADIATATAALRATAWAPGLPHPRVPEQRQPTLTTPIPCTSSAGHKLAADNRTCIRCHAEFTEFEPPEDRGP